MANIFESKGYEVDLFNRKVFFHWSLGLLLFDFIFYGFSIVYILVSILSTVLLILVHEFGHAFMCKWRKYDVEEIMVHYWGGYCSHEEVDYRRDQIWISMGGIIFQFILLLVASVLYFVKQQNVYPNALVHFILIGQLVQKNVVMILFNLLPLPGLDGYYVFDAIDFSEIKYKVKTNKISIKKNKQKLQKKERKQSMEKDALINEIMINAKKSYEETIKSKK
jgi:stage IV sporulation protein FB